MTKIQKKFEDKVIKEICDIITDMTNSGRKTDTEPAAEDNKGEKKTETYMAVGLGNRFATPDALGPVVMEKIMVNRHMVCEFGSEILGNNKVVCAITPGVMAQTGMDTYEVLCGLVENIKPDLY